MVIATGHGFNHVNKRTALRALNAVLRPDGIRIARTAGELGQISIRVVRGRMEQAARADWLRERV